LSKKDLKGDEKQVISYKPLFHTMIEKDISRARLKELTNLGANTLSKLYTGKHVALEVIERICLKLGVPVSAVLEILPSDDEKDAKEDTGKKTSPSKKKGALAE